MTPEIKEEVVVESPTNASKHYNRSGKSPIRQGKKKALNLKESSLFDGEGGDEFAREGSVSRKSKKGRVMES